MRKREPNGSNLRDVAILLFLFAAFSGAILSAFASAEQQIVYFLMLAGLFLTAVAGFFGKMSLAVAVGGTQLMLYTALKLYQRYAQGAVISLSDFFWLGLIPVILLALFLYHRGAVVLEQENQLLRMQVEEMVTIDALTGLYNLRAFYREWSLAKNYCDRNSLPLSLMIVKLRYAQEMNALLPQQKYDEVRRRVAQLVVETMRLEDRVFAIDNEGSLALILFTDIHGAEVVKQRVRTCVEEPSAFHSVVNADLRVSLRIASLQYSREDYVDAMRFRQRVESELVYDV